MDANTNTPATETLTDYQREQASVMAYEAFVANPEIEAAEMVETIADCLGCEDLDAVESYLRSNSLI